MTHEQRANLEMYSDGTYGIALGEIGRELERLGFVEWVPPVFGNTPTYAITQAGKEAIKENPND